MPSNLPRNLMDIFLYVIISACRNAPGTSKVTTSLTSCVLTTIVKNNASGDTVGDATFSPSFRYLNYILLPVNVLPLIWSYLFYLIKLTASRVLVVSHSSVNNVILIG